MAWPPACGAKASMSHCTLQHSSKPAWFGSTAQIFSTPPAASVAIAKAVSDAKAGAKVCANILSPRGSSKRLFFSQSLSPSTSRKNIRNAVEAARKAESWGMATAHNRAQVLYYIAENLSQRREEIAARLSDVAGKKQAEAEVAMGIERIFSYAAWTDKYDGAVRNPP